MKHLKFEIDIMAPKEKVWDVLWNDETYRKWTSAFNEGSYAVSDWNEGSEIQFLGPGENGEGGMFSVIDKKVPAEFMSFKHLGVIKDGVALPMDEETKQWTGAMENYHLSERNDLTHLTVDLDTVESHADYFNDMFPKALQIVKELSEK